MDGEHDRVHIRILSAPERVVQRKVGVGGVKVGERVLRLRVSVTVIKKLATGNKGGILSIVEMTEQYLTVVIILHRRF